MSRAGQRAWGWFKRVAPWGLAALVLALVAGQARTRVAISGIKVAKLCTGSASSGNFDAALSCAEAE